MCSDKSKGNVLILAEYAGKEIDSTTTQLIIQGRELAEKLGVAVDALLVGNGLGPQSENLCKMGVDRVLLLEHANLELYNPELYSGIIARVIKDLMPSFFLLGYTYWGMVVGPGVATRLGARLFTNCLDLELEGEMVRVTRPMFGGITYAKVEARRSIPVIVSLQKSTSALKSAPGGVGEIVPLALEISEGDFQTKALGILAELAGAEDLKKAELIVAAGRGIKEKANLKLIEEFADALGGVVGCSRPLVDLGWLPLPYQVGISGKTVRPKVYIACGISGAMQHVSAITDSQMIIAINSDPKAPIFRVAKYGILGDLFEVIPRILRKAKERNVRASSV